MVQNRSSIGLAAYTYGPRAGSATPVAGDILAIEVLGPGALDAASNNFMDGNDIAGVRVRVKGFGAGGVYDATKLWITPTIPGYDGSRAATLRQRTIIAAKPPRQPSPSYTSVFQKVVGSDIDLYFVMPERIYAGVSIVATVFSGLYTYLGTPSNASADFTVVSNNSTFAYERPQSAVYFPSWTVYNAPPTVEIFAAHHWGESSRPVACIEAIFTDGTHSFSVYASTCSDSPSRINGVHAPTYQFTPTGGQWATLNDGVVTMSYKLYAWRGSTVWDSETFGSGPSGATMRGGPTGQTSQMHYDTMKSLPLIKNDGGTWAVRYAVVHKSPDPLGGVAGSNVTGLIQSTLVAAQLTPFRTPEYATYALQLYSSGTSINVVTILYLGEGSWVGFRDGTATNLSPTQIYNQNRTVAKVHVLAEPGTTAANVIWTGAGDTIGSRLPSRMDFDGIVFSSDALNSIFTGIDNQADWTTTRVGFFSDWTIRNCTVTSTGTPGSSYKLATSCGRVELINNNFLKLGNFSPGNRSAIALAAFNSHAVSSADQMSAVCVIGDDTITPTAMAGSASLESPTRNIGLYYFFRALNYPVTFRLAGVGTIQGYSDEGGLAMVGYLLVPNTATAKGIELSGDGFTPKISNLCVQFGSIPNEDHNLCYNEVSLAVGLAVLNNWITTTSGSNVVQINKTGISSLPGAPSTPLVVGSYVWLINAIAVGGITVGGQYQVNTISTNSFTVIHSANATSSASGGTAASGCIAKIGEAASNIRKTGTMRYVLAQSNNVKRDTYVNNGTLTGIDFQRVGNMSLAFWVDWTGIFLWSSSDEGNGGPVSLLGEWINPPASPNDGRQLSVVYGLSNYGPSTPAFNASWQPLTASSLAINKVPAASGVWGNGQSYPIDIFGNARRTDGTGATGGAESV